MAFRQVRSKIILSFCVLMVVGGLVTTLVVRYSLRVSLQAAAVERAHVVAELLAEQIAAPVAAGDWDKAKLLIDTEADHNAFVVLETPDRVLSGAARRHLLPAHVPAVAGRRGPSVVEHEGVPAVSVPAPLPDGIAGVLHVGVSLGPSEEIERTVVREVLAITLGAMLVGIAGIVFLSGLITRPIAGLTRAARSMGAGDLEAEAPVAGRDEIAELAGSFNVMAQQIRERIAASEDLRDYYERILDHLTKGVLVYEGGVIEYANRSAGATLGARAGQPVSKLFGPGAPLGELPDLASTTSGEVWRATRATDDGRTLALAAARLGSHGRAVVVSVNDVSELSRLAERLRRTERIAAAGEVAAGIVHAINNPLDGVHRALELAKRRPEDPRRMESLLELALEGTDRIAQITRSLLSFARADETGSGVEVAATDVLRSAVELVALRAEQSSVSLETETDVDVPKIRVEPRALTDVLVNLLSNALDVAPRGSEVIGQVRRGKSGGVEISVLDRGPGVPVELRQRIFEPFFTTKDTQHGTGLGLSMARRIVESLGGQIEAREREGGGSCFAVWLPAAPPIGENTG